MSTEDDEHSGRPKEMVTEESIKKIHKIILNDRQLKLNEIADTLKISTELDDSEQCLKMIKRNKPEFLRQYVTMDETWLHHFTPKFNRQSPERTAHDEPAQKRGKTQQSAGKVMASGC
ncbi:hypothetical protein GWI33_000385 [Rhynchophorus ferrugineus]|uniref:Uncharacterized protein n=1 Tax=Rhynchophorus ferrugineus TaxID=354439 RepID=A0A834HM95_RHYFE|nr:hypothetical protein GWI33_000385 [Rhynchophorus ferrugineus]